MTKQDYNLIAEAIREAAHLLAHNRPALKQSADIANLIASCFTDRLSNTNPRFDADRFVDACTSEL